MKCSLQKRKDTASSSQTPTLLGILMFSTVFALAAVAADPGWWSNNGLGSQPAVVAEQVVTNSGVVTTNYVPVPDGVVTQGQVKQFTARAVDELNAALPGGAGTNLNAMVTNWAQDYLTNGWSATNIKPSDYSAMTLGQLKTVANMVYGRISDAGYTNLAPSWLPENTNSDGNVAVLGQLKEVFNFDFSMAGVSNLTATPSGPGMVNLNWSLPGGANSAPWIVEEQDASGAWMFLASLNSTNTSYSISGLTNGQSYNFQVFASQTNNVSALASVSATPGGVPSSGLALWFKADAGVTADGSGNVSQWVDQASGITATLNSSTSPLLATNVINGKPGVVFNGTQRLTATNTVSLDGDWTIFLFGESDDIGFERYALGLGNMSATGGQRGYGTFVSSPVLATCNSYAANGAYLNPGEENISETVYTQTNSTVTFYERGDLVGSGAPYVSTTTAGVNIGDISNGNYPRLWNGTIHEIIAYNRALSGTERQQVEGYLADKYGVYNANANWPSTYSSVVQGEISRFHWSKAQADAYVSGLATNTSIPTTGLAVWLKPDAGLNSTGTNVASWSDQTPNQNNASPSATPPSIITGGMAGFSAVHFDGSGNNFMAIADGVSVRPSHYTILAVAKENSIGSSQFLISRPYYDNTGPFYGWGSPYMSFAAMLDQDGSTYLRSYATTGGTGVDNRGQNTYDISQPHEFSWRYDGTNQDVYYDGHSTSSTSVPTSGDISYSGQSAPLTIGNHDAIDFRGGSAVEPLDGDVYEILVYARSLTDAEKQQAEVYLADKYGLYNPHATWPLTYSLAVQAEITKHHWNKTQADGYVTFQAANPTMLTAGLTIWLKADSGVTSGGTTPSNGGNVDSWADQTGNYTVTQGTSGSQPTYVTNDLNGKQGVRFNGNQWLSYSGTADPGLKSDITIITVAETTSPSTQTYSIYLGQDSGPDVDRGIGYYSGNEIFDTYGAYCSGGAAPGSGTFLTEAATLDATRSNVTFYQNGAVTGTGTLSGVLPLSPGITVGAAGGGSCGWQGDITEELVYDHKLSPAELQQVSLYLSNKYGLAYSPAITISPSGGSYTSTQTVSLSTGISGGVIHYTVDGTQPTVSSPTYTSSISVSASALVQAVVTVSGVVSSPLAAAQYYINDSSGTGLPTPPASLTATSVSDTETDLAWTLTGMVNYNAINIYRSTNGGGYVLIGVLDSSATSYQDLSVLAGNSYTYEVGTSNQSGIANSSASSSITPSSGSALNITITTPAGATPLP